MASAGPSTAACAAELGSGCGMRRAAEASSSWLVNEWKRRGLIDHDPTDAEIDSVMHSSYFWRRNKNRPSKTPASPSMEAEADTNWLARRNKKSCRNKCGLRRERSASIERVESWSVSIASAMLDVQGRLPKPPQLLKLDREVKPQQAARALVYLTLYDLSPCWNVINHHVGMGMYHSGIELAASAESEGTEFTFDHHAGRSSGVAWHVPYYADRKRDAELPLRTRRLLGRSPLALQEALQLLLDMAPSWLSSQYDLLDRNCHHWSDTAAAALGVAPIPRWVDRTARCLGQLRGMPAEGGSDGHSYDENSDASDGGGASPGGSRGRRGRRGARGARDGDGGDGGGYCSMGADFIHMRSSQPHDTLECVPLMSRAAQLDEPDDDDDGGEGGGGGVLKPPGTPPGAHAARGVAAGGAADASPVSAPPSMTRNPRNSV